MICSLCCLLIASSQLVCDNCVTVSFVKISEGVPELDFAVRRPGPPTLFALLVPHPVTGLICQKGRCTAHPPNPVSASSSQLNFPINGLRRKGAGGVPQEYQRRFRLLFTPQFVVESVTNPPNRVCLPSVSQGVPPRICHNVQGA